jgi:hypothetical protein
MLEICGWKAADRDARERAAIDLHSRAMLIHPIQQSLEG